VVLGRDLAPLAGLLVAGVGRLCLAVHRDHRSTGPPKDAAALEQGGGGMHPALGRALGTWHAEKIPNARSGLVMLFSRSRVLPRVHPSGTGTTRPLCVAKPLRVDRRTAKAKAQK